MRETANTSGRASVAAGELGPARVAIDTGWPFLAAGILLLGATVLIPAMGDLDEARWQRDRALALEAHRLDRLANYEGYLGALEAADPGLVQALAASQLNRIPEGRSVILPVAGGHSGWSQGTGSASVFPMLEPGPLKSPARVEADSALAKMTMGERTRAWLIAGGGVLLFVGLLPVGGRGR
jgi:hypothetical protein